MELQTSPSDQLPPRLAWFAPWRWFAHWKPWQRWTALAVMVVLAYVASLEPVEYVVVRSGISAYSTRGYRTFNIIYWPLQMLRDRSPAMYRFYYWEYSWLNSLFGPAVTPESPLF